MERQDPLLNRQRTALCMRAISKSRTEAALPISCQYSVIAQVAAKVVHARDVSSLKAVDMKGEVRREIDYVKETATWFWVGIWGKR